MSIGPRGWDRPGGRRATTTLSARKLGYATVTRRAAGGPSAWIGLGLMAANTAVALVDLFMLAGSIPK